MTLADLVPSLALCRELRDAGFPQAGALLVWVSETPMDEPIVSPWCEADQYRLRRGIVECAAPTAAEIDERLPVGWVLRRLREMSYAEASGTAAKGASMAEAAAELYLALKRKEQER